MAEAQGTPPSPPTEGSIIFALLVLLAGAVASCAANYCTSINGTAMDKCFAHLQPILENPSFSGLPSSKDEVERLCKGFKLGMKCVDEFAKYCLNRKQKELMEQTVLGARITMNYLCNDLAFQKEYLKHTSCYAVLSEEWDMCGVKMKNAIEQDKSSNNPKINSEKLTLSTLCCAKYQFRVCTEEVAKRKCTTEAALFLRNIAESLTSPMLNGQCRDVESEMMSVKIVTLASARSAADGVRSLTATALLPFYIIVSAVLT